MMWKRRSYKLKGDISDHGAFSWAIRKAGFKPVCGDFRFAKSNYPIQGYHTYQIAKGASGDPQFSQ